MAQQHSYAPTSSHQSSQRPSTLSNSQALRDVYRWRASSHRQLGEELLPSHASALVLPFKRHSILHPLTNSNSSPTPRSNQCTQQGMMRRHLTLILHRCVEVFEFVVPELFEDLAEEGDGRVVRWKGGEKGVDLSVVERGGR